MTTMRTLLMMLVLLAMATTAVAQQHPVLVPSPPQPPFVPMCVGCPAPR